MKNSLLVANQTEMQLMPIVMEMERVGVHLHPDIADIAAHWEAELSKGDDEIRKVIGPDVKIGGKLMFNKLRELKLVDESKIEYTAKGNARYGREFLDKILLDDNIATVLKKRSKLTKIMGTYLRPWAASAATYNGWMYPYFNQVRNLDDRGTRTGRFSSNMQQIPKEPDPELVDLRSLIYPDNEDHIVLVRDFSSQEIRVAAHYSEGAILQAYVDDPDLEVHNFVMDLILKSTGVQLERRVSKTITFLKMYGGGAKMLAEMLHITVEEAYAFFDAYDSALPEFKQLSRDVEAMVRDGVLLRTWGGRLYDVEPPEYVSGERWEKYYKLSNTLIQGSSADMTKHAMIRYYQHQGRKGRLMLQVHDELVISVHEKHMKEEMALLEWAMNEILGWDVPIRSSGDFGPSYGELTKWQM